MKKIFAAFALLSASAMSAGAADLPARMYSKAPPPAPAVASWTGCYVGGGGGYGLYDARTQQFLGAPAIAAPNPPTTINRQLDQGGRGYIGTVQGGCDYQFSLGSSQWVVGGFADYNWSDIKGEFTGGGGAVGLISNRERIDDYWAVGGRLGWLVNPQTLTYVSGGYTEAHRKGIGNYLTALNAPTGIGLRGGDNRGYFIGSGIEHHIGWFPNLTWKTEYRFSEFDTRNNFEYVVATGANIGSYSRDRLYTHAVTSTLSYRFNWGGPVVARY